MRCERTAIYAAENVGLASAQCAIQEIDRNDGDNPILIN